LLSDLVQEIGFRLLLETLTFRVVRITVLTLGRFRSGSQFALDFARQRATRCQLDGDDFNNC
jgi:hypothetical protein